MPAQSRKHWRHSNVVFRNLGDQISLTTVKDLVGSMPDRLKSVIINEGDTVLY